MKRTIVLVALLFALPAIAQESPSFKLSEFVFNAGGNPEQGIVPASAEYRFSLDAVGDAVAARGLSSPNYRMDASFASAYPPPGEVRNVAFGDSRTVEWDPEPSTGVYNLYRGLISQLPSASYGNCEQQDLTAETADEPGSPPLGEVYMYLITAENRRAEEGTKGYGSDAAERPNPAPCP